MNLFEEFLSELLYEGRLVVRPDAISETPGQSVENLLHAAFERYRLDIAGPGVTLDVTVALAASRTLWEAARALVDHSEPVESMVPKLVMPHPPRTASEHLSADLLFRFLAQVYGRACAANPGDPLVTSIAAILQQWPLSGVLADLEQGPGIPIDFSRHYGLSLLYAERWIRHKNEAWRPAGPEAEFIEWVLDRSARESQARVNVRSFHA